MSFARGLRERAGRIWEDGYNHPFVQELGQGTLDKKKFQFYLLQDYQYLLQYAKVFALACVKADTEAQMTRLTNVQHSMPRRSDREAYAMSNVRKIVGLGRIRYMDTTPKTSVYEKSPCVRFVARSKLYDSHPQANSRKDDECDPTNSKASFSL